MCLSLSKIHLNTSPGKACVTKTTQLNLFSSKLTKSNWERTEMSLLGRFIALQIVISRCLMVTSELLTKIKSKRRYVSCLGDYNISLLNYNSPRPTQEFADLMYSHSLFSCITKPTGVTACSYFKSVFFSDQNIEQFSSNLWNRNWSDLLSCNDPDLAYTVFSNTITELFDSCFPLRSVKRGYKTRKLWLSEGLEKINWQEE